ncbi:AraC family transcriptional regulator [Marinobacterium nitratireducens]|uniref:AraC family transcriptional regulator n=1 Tax=Marinobacterium nitratireducens TaxID=518897 RepID=A0A917ZAK9_9GAMM|nr:AraC family transcriptional regulator [Marinobacterium nitratireducens]GGO78959.1 AraC family transcriptional regulator [Marinobacterium nitratireducens]
MSQPKNVPQVKSSALMGLYPLCRKLHVNPIKLLTSEGLSGTILRSGDIMIPYESFCHVLNRGADTADFPLFGIAMSSYQGLKTFGPLGLLAAESPTVGDALNVIEKYFHFHARGAAIDLQAREKETDLILTLNLDPSVSMEQTFELSLCLGYNVLKELAPDWMPRVKLLFAHSPLASMDEYRKFTDARLCFDQDKNAIVFPTQLLMQKPTPASDEIRSYLESFLEKESQGHDQPLQYKVSKLILELIPTGEATLPTIAPMLGMNVRTLQRELQLAGTEFRTLLDEVRYQVAREALERNYTLTEIALNLGYSELSAFSRAFKRWSGVSPQQWRQSF